MVEISKTHTHTKHSEKKYPWKGLVSMKISDTAFLKQPRNFENSTPPLVKEWGEGVNYGYILLLIVY